MIVVFSKKQGANDMSNSVNINPAQSYAFPSGNISWQVFNETNIQGSYQVTLSSGQLLEKHTVDAHGHSAITGGDYTGATITNTGNTSLNLKIN